jgi:hypothetical protein
MPKRSKNSVSKKTQTKKKSSDEDYELPKEPERRFPTNAVVDQNASLLDQHADYLIEMMAKRTRKTGPAWIAKQLCKKLGLHDDAIHSRQISNWYDYRVRTGKISHVMRRSVSHYNAYLAATRANCMQFILLFILLQYLMLREG